MIKNIIFDMGNVLMDFQPAQFTSIYFPDEADAALAMAALFRNPAWAGLDEGTCTPEAFLSGALPMLPKNLHAPARELFFHWHEHMKPILPVNQLAGRLKTNGYGLYILSNAAMDFYLYCPKQLPAYPLFDGIVVSAEEKMVKPDPRIYRLICSRYQLVPQECFFIDDRRENVESAVSTGMRGFVFSGDVTGLTAALEESGVQTALSEKDETTE